MLKLTKAHLDYKMALRDKNMLPVIAYGPAGCSKTYSAVEFAVEWLETKGRKVVVTRPNVSFAQELGFLPGTEREKMEPWVRPVNHCFYSLGLTKGAVENLEKNGTLTYIPLEYIQGLTFDNTFLLIDEAQNMSLEQMKVVLTRQGNWSKVVMCGDIAQTSPKFPRSGLKELLDMVDATGIPVHTICFEAEDILRSKQCRAWIEAFDDWDIIKRTIV